MKRSLLLVLAALTTLTIHSQHSAEQVKQFEHERIQREIRQMAMHRPGYERQDPHLQEVSGTAGKMGFSSQRSLDPYADPAGYGMHSTLSESSYPETKEGTFSSRSVGLKSASADIGDTPDWNWVRTITGSDGAYANNFALDASNNAYVIGTYSDSLGISGISKVSTGLRGVFIAKLDVYGKLLWVRTLEVLPGESANGYEVALTGSSVVVSGEINSDRLSGGGKVANRTGEESMFLASLSTDGEVNWINLFETDDWIQKMLCDQSGNIYLLGNYKLKMFDASGNLQWTTDPDVYLQDFTINNSELWVSGATLHDSVKVGGTGNPAGGPAYFIAKVNDGDFGSVFFMDAGYSSPQWDRIFIRLDSDGNIYLAGSHSGDITIGALVLTGYKYMFALKLDPDYNVQWYHDEAQPDNGYVYLYDFYQVSDKQFYILGYFSGSSVNFSGTVYPTELDWGYFIGNFNENGTAVNFYKYEEYPGSGVIGPSNTLYTSTNDNYDTWIHKRSLAGGDFWTIQLVNNGGYAQLRYTMDIDGDGNLYAQGYYSGKVNLYGNYTKGEGNFFVKFRNNGSVEWLRTMDCPDGNGSGLTVDAAGNVYAWGTFYNYIRIGGQELTNTKEDSPDMYLVKFDSDGELKFVKQFKCTGYAYGYGGISMTPQGDVMITGAFYDTLALGAYELVSNKSYSNYAYDIFVTRVGPTGNIIWARNYGGPNYDYGRGIDTDSTGSVYITGYFSDSIKFDSVRVKLDPGYYNDFYLVKLKPNGDIDWVRSGGPKNYQVQAYAIAVNGDNVYIQGQAQTYPPDNSNVYFGNTVLTSEFQANSFVASYTTSGDLNWARMIKVNNYSYPVYEIDTDEKGNVYVGGLFSDSIVVGSTLVAGTGWSDYYIAKYKPDGDLDWMKTAQSSNSYGELSLYSLSVFEEDIVLVGGNFWDGSFDLGGVTVSTASGAVLAGLLGGDIVGCDFGLVLDIEDEDFGQGDGSANLTINGGTAPYTTEWSNGESDQLLVDSLFAGTYQVTVTDAKGCQQYAVFSVNVKNGPVITLDTIGNVTCYGAANGFINISVNGGTKPYSYYWDNGYSTEDINNLKAAPYAVTVTDANGLIVSATFTVTEPKELDVSYTLGLATCGGGSDGKIDVFTSGGTPPYDWEWNTGVFTESLANAAAGKYTLTVLDKHNCELEEEIALSEKDAPIVETEFTEPANCGLADGSAKVKVINAVGNINFLWSDASATTDATLTGQKARGYFVTVINDGGCKAIHLVNITEKKPIENQICLVTVDTVVGSNLVVWEKVDEAIEYHIFRETTAKDIYLLAGTTLGTDLSVFVDTVANPLIRSYRYKIAAVDECGNESFLSHLHKTVHMTISRGLTDQIMNIRWDDYVGEDFESFEVWRYSSLNSWEKLATLPSNLKSYTDDDVPPGLVFYNVRVPFANLCQPTGDLKKAGTGPYSHSLSNLDDNKLKTPVEKSYVADRFYVYPNPTRGLVTVWSDAFQITDGQIMISDLAGRTVLQDKFQGNLSGRLEIDLSAQSAGAYLVRLQTNGQVFFQKLVKQ